MAENKYIEHLYEERRALFLAMLDQSKSFDRWLLTLAGGTFGLSMIFIYQIAPSPKSYSIGWLITGWAFCGLSVLSTLLSFLSSQEACDEQIQNVDKLISGEIDSSKSLSSNDSGRKTKVLNYCSMTAFLIGIICLITFAVINLLSAKGV